MESLEAIAQKLRINRDKIELISPGSYVVYNDEKKKSSHVTLSSSEGIIRKEKKRSHIRAVYEFLALEVVNELLNNYSQVNDLTFRSPKPLGLYEPSTAVRDESPIPNTGLLMSFINGYELKKLGVMKRNTPVAIKRQSMPLPLFPACAYHLGALNRIKEEEKLFHDDYDDRHVLFSPIQNVSIGVIDLENARLESNPELIKGESMNMFTQFQLRTHSPRDRDALDSWYYQGMDSLVIPEEDKRIGAIIERVKSKYSVDIDFLNKKINGFNA